MTYFRKDFEWLNEDSLTFLKNGYLKEGTNAIERIRQIANRAEELSKIQGFSDKFFNYMARGYYSLASPVWANFGNERGLPISCNGSNIEDSMDDIMYTAAEVGMLTKYGAGTAAYFGNLRERGAPIKDNGKSNGAFSFVPLFDKLMDVTSQGNTRRGNFAAYYPIDGGDFDEFMDIKMEGSTVQNIFYGVCVGSDWFNKMWKGDAEGRRRWAKVLDRRNKIGLPYIFFTDNVNNNKPQVFKDKNLVINHSQLCTEIFLPTNKDWTFVCDLSSINLLHWDEIKDTDAIETLTIFLDVVMEEYILKTKNIPFLKKAHKFAKEHRSLGVGVLGWHSYLQSKMIPFESFESMTLNNSIFKIIQEKTESASKWMAKEWGEPLIMEGYGMRNSALQAVAPTTSSAFILGQVSQSIEPIKSNFYVRDLAKSKTTFKNKILEDLLVLKGKNTSDVWKSIKLHNGSVAHLEFLTAHEKNVFKTFAEISQLEIIQQAAQRQKYIDQGQSLNLTISPKIPIKDVNQLYKLAHDLGIKSLYYQHSVNAAQEFARNILTCSSCEG